MDKKLVVITGTSSGFGFLLALALATQGYYVIATMRDMTKKKRLLSEAKKQNISNLEVVQLDVTNSQQIEELKNYIETSFGNIDVLVNNAGYCAGGMTEHISMDEWIAQFETNVFSVVAITKAFLPMMRKQKRGKIVNIGSISGRFGFPAMGAYASSKWALAGFSESLRLELLPFNIYVSLVEAGSFQTDIWGKSLQNVQIKPEQEEYKEYLQFIYHSAQQTANQAEDPQKVIHLIKKICDAKKPKLRYQVGKGVKLQIALKTVLPWSAIETVFIKKIRK